MDDEVMDGYADPPAGQEHRVDGTGRAWLQDWAGRWWMQPEPGGLWWPAFPDTLSEEVCAGCGLGDLPLSHTSRQCRYCDDLAAERLAP